MMYIAYKKINGYTISDNTDHQRFLYRRGVSAPTILVAQMLQVIAVSQVPVFPPLHFRQPLDRHRICFVRVIACWAAVGKSKTQ